MRIETEPKLDFSDVLIRPKRSTIASREEVDLRRSFTFRHGNCNEYSGIPIMAANMDGVGTLAMADALESLGLFTVLTKDHTAEQLRAWMDAKPGLVNYDSFSISTGVTAKDFARTQEIINTCPEIKYVTVDVANGYSEPFIEGIAHIREAYPELVIIAGNVVTPDVTEELILQGADIVKVGIGPGSVCTTRIKTGVGYPQLSAIIECADAAHGLGGHIIADGGCASPGDVSKAFGAGADFVMLGGMLSGTDQGGGRVEAGKVNFYGMSSNTAQEKHGGRKNYRASEGRLVSVPYRGDVQPVVRDMLGGVRSTCAYVGARSLKELTKRTTFVKTLGGKTHNTVFENLTVGD